MADRETELIARLAPGVAGIDSDAWDRLAGGDPFLSHAFLSALEQSGSVGPGTGWSPAPIMIEDETGALAAAVPAYLKSHSQGEYVFDHGWADAFERAGGQYYPKLQVAVPFTPVPGRRLLGHFPQQLLAAAEAVTVQNVMWADDRPFWSVTASAAASSCCGRAPSSRGPGTGVNGTAICSLG